MTSETKNTPDRAIDYLSKEGLDLLARLYPEHADNDRILFANQCNRTQLDPANRQIYSVQRKGKWATQTSIDGFRVIAQRSGEYQGQVGPHWCGPDGVWVDVWLGSAPPIAARVGVWRAGFREPLYGIARYDAYVGRKASGEITEVWKNLDDVMTAKCAEAQALRRAFPQELSNLYTAEEMAQADNPGVIRREEPAAPGLEKQLADSIKLEKATAKATKPAPAPEPAEEPAPEPVKTEAPEMLTLNQDYDLAKYRGAIESIESAAGATEFLKVWRLIKDPVVKTAVAAVFKKLRESKGWEIERNAAGEATGRVIDPKE